MVPSQQSSLIGFSLDSTTLAARLSQECLDGFLSCVRPFHVGKTVTYRLCVQVAGLMTSAIHLTCLSRLFWDLSEVDAGSQDPAYHGPSTRFGVSTCLDSLRLWSRAPFLSEGVR